MIAPLFTIVLSNSCNIDGDGWSAPGKGNEPGARSFARPARGAFVVDQALRSSFCPLPKSRASTWPAGVPL